MLKAHLFDIKENRVLICHSHRNQKRYHRIHEPLNTARLDMLLHTYTYIYIYILTTVIPSQGTQKLTYYCKNSVIYGNIIVIITYTKMFKLFLAMLMSEGFKRLSFDTLVWKVISLTNPQ